MDDTEDIYLLAKNLYRHVNVANIDQNTGTNPVLVKCFHILPATIGSPIRIWSSRF